MAVGGKILKTTVQILGEISPTLGKSIGDVEKRLGGINKAAVIAGAAVGAAVVAAGKFTVDATKNAIEFEAQMSNVGTLLEGDVKKRLAELGPELINVSNLSGKATEDLTDGLYQVVSAFGDSAESAKILEVAAKAATAGNASTTDSINLLSAVTKGYNDTSAEAQKRAADLAFTTAKLGQTNFPELAANMGKVIPLASTLAVKQEDLFGAMATLTGVTGGTAEVTTQLKATMQGFLQPTADMQKAIENYGFSSGKAMLESEGLQGSLDLLKAAVGGNELEFAKLFGSVEAKSAVLAMVGSQSDNLRDKTAAMYEATGAAEAAFATQTDNLKTKMANLQNKFENTKTTVGMKLLPVISKIADKAFPFLEKAADGIAVAFDKMGGIITTYVVPAFEKAQPAIDGVVNFVGSLGDHMNVVLPIVAGLTAAIVAYRIASKLMAIYEGIKTAALATGTTVTSLASAATWALGSAMAFLTSPIFLVVAAIGAVIAIGVLLYRNWDTVKQKAGELGEKISSIWGSISGAVQNAISAISGCFPVLGAYLQGFWSSIQDVWANVQAIFSGAIEFINNVFAGNWSGAWQNIIDIFGNIFGMIGNIAKAPINGVISIVNKAIEGINSLTSGLKIPDWIPFIGGKEFSLNIPSIPLLAAGGFTNGVSIAGEAGTEAVISFDPAYRDDNLSYWAKAGRMLGADTGGTSFTLSGNSTAGGVNLGGVVFAPDVKVYGNAEKESVMQAIEAEYPEFIDLLDEWYAEKGRAEYAQ